MTFTFSGKFSKGHYCPSSQSLLAYHEANLPGYQWQSVEVHLAVCDFCNAELQLLARHQSTFEESAFGEMPPQLRRLAQQLLKHSAPAAV